VPADQLRWLGVIPAAMGFALLFRKNKTEETEKFTGGGIVPVALVTVANGADNLGVYIPLFATSSTQALAVYGAIFVGGLPQVIALLRDYLPGAIARTPGLEPGLFGLVMILIVLFEPMGIYGRWLKIKAYFDYFPLYRRATFKRQRSYLKTERVR